MDTIILNEHEQSEPIELSFIDLNAFLSLPNNIFKLTKADKGWAIETNSRVGNFLLPSGCRVVVRPKVPVNNLLYMLASHYELATFNNFNNFNNFNTSDDYETIDIYVFIFHKWLDRLMKKGLIKKYFVVEEEVTRVKGKYKISFGCLNKARFLCEFDEHSYDTLFNQIICSTLRLILSLNINRNLHTRTKEYFRRLSSISEITLHKDLFQKIFYNRHDRVYKPIISICHLIFTNSILHEQTGLGIFPGFFVDMNRLFEDFVRQSIHIILPHLNIHKSVKRDWACAKQQTDHLPVLKPDILVEGIKIIDTKYYKSPIHKGTLHSSHLYQLLTYCQAYKLSGLLVYPENGFYFEETYQFGNCCIGIITVRLDGTIDDLKKSLDNLAKLIM